MKKLLSIVLVGAMALSLSACGGGSGTDQEAPPASENSTNDSAGDSNEGASTDSLEESNEAKKESATAKSPDNDLVVAMQADATHLDPHVSSNGVSNQITNEMYETLLTFDADTNVIPLLAKEWSVSEDGKAYTFILNEGITFHDGEPFNAESVKAV